MNELDDEPVIAFAETLEEREAVYRLRYTVYSEEMGVYHSVADHKRRVLIDPWDATGRLLCARIGGEVVGSMRIHLGAERALPEPFKVIHDLQRFVAIVPLEQMSVYSRFMVAKAHRHSQVSFRLMSKMYEFSLQQGCQLGFTNCAPHLVNLYLALGFRTYTRNYNNPETGFVVPMVHIGRDLNYMARIASPWWEICKKYVTATDIPSWVDSILPLESNVQSERADAQEYWSLVHGLLSEKSKGGPFIFDGLTADEVKQFAQKGHLIHCLRGELIIRKGTVSHGIYVVLSGTVEVRDGDRFLAVMTQGEVLGELGFLTNSPRTADVYALSDDVQILSLDERILRQLIKSDPTMSAKFLLNLSKVLCLRLVEVRSRFASSEH